MNIIALVLLILSVLLMLAYLIMMRKNVVTYRNQSTIAHAIFEYHMDVINKAKENGTILDKLTYEVEYDDMRDFNDTLMRIFDWGYEHILPDDKFEIIKPYIHK